MLLKISRKLTMLGQPERSHLEVGAWSLLQAGIDEGHVEIGRLLR